MSWTEEEYAKFLLQKGKPSPSVAPTPSKYHAVITECDGIKFRSKKEASRYRELACLKHAGECWFLRQVPFYLPGETKYLLDFMIFWKDGKVTCEDVKGKRLASFIKAKKQVEALYPVKILEV